MTSILTNRWAALAAQALNAANKTLITAQTRIATGLRIASAKDNGALWGVGVRMRSEVNALGTVKDSLGRGQSLLQVASAGAEQIVDLLARAREKAVALRDTSLSTSAQDALRADIQALQDQIERTALQAEFDGKRPLADKQVPTTVTYTSSSYGAATPSALTPASLSGSIAPSSGVASQTVVRDGGTASGRVDLYLDAYSVPDVLEIWQGGTRVAATGRAYVAAGAGVGAGTAVSGQNILSFDYHPAAGRNLEFRFNENGSASGTAWAAPGVELRALASPRPVAATSSTVVPGVLVSAPLNYAFVSGTDGEAESVSSKAMTLNALGLDRIDWSQPGGVLESIDIAVTKANEAAVYFGQRAEAFDRLVAQTGQLADTLETGVGNLVDADLPQESARLEAAQSRQSLAVNALSIANAYPRWLADLFR
ncbi:flagellin [Caulobacter sp. ErkDOM-E]|uniref:flagellin N-terminal helical domain-containing protein n=1 Tax=Caulobacter sp. ErkDOM-E TaxID=3402778 RepID=UPI003AF4F819